MGEDWLGATVRDDSYSGARVGIVFVGFGSDLIPASTPSRDRLVCADPFPSQNTLGFGSDLIQANTPVSGSGQPNRLVGADPFRCKYARIPIQSDSRKHSVQR